MNANSDNILEIDRIEVLYDNVIAALHDVSLNVPRGKIVALLGGNGAGKSTTLKAISTMLAAERGVVTKGSITYDGIPVRGQNPAEMVGLGMVQVLEGRRCFGAGIVSSPSEANGTWTWPGMVMSAWISSEITSASTPRHVSAMCSILR